MNLIYYLPRQLPIDVRLRILGNQEIKRKSLNCVVTQASLPGIIFWQQWSVFTQKQISDFSDFTTLLDFLTFCQILCHQLQFQCNISRDVPISMFLEETSNVNEFNMSQISINISFSCFCIPLQLNYIQYILKGIRFWISPLKFLSLQPKVIQFVFFMITKQFLHNHFLQITSFVIASTRCQAHFGQPPHPDHAANFGATTSHP